MSKQEDNGEDRISALPDDIICSILSNFYVEESARTSILSKRWRNMWLLSPITIFDESIVKQSCIYCFTEEESSYWIVNAMSHIISTHPGPIPTCHFILPDWHEYHETLVNTLKTLTLKGIRNLQINLRDFEFPCFVFECDTLVDVQLRCGLLPAQLPAHANIFPNLRKLILANIKMSNEFLVNLLSSRSIIELALITCYGFRDVVIESDCLQKLYFRGTGDHYDVDLTIKAVPNLETFKYVDLPRHSKVVILNAPKLKVLSCIAMNISMLQLGNYQFDFYARSLKIRGETAHMPSLQSLDIVVDFDRGQEAKSVSHFLMCFPCLEALKVRMKGESSTCSSDDEYYDSLKSEVSTANGAVAIDVDGDYEDYVHLMSNINCLNYHLKNVRLSDFYGVPAHLEFARLIVANAKVLETLTIVYGNVFEERRMKALQHFLMQNRASMMLRVEFVAEESKRRSTLVRS